MSFHEWQAAVMVPLEDDEAEKWFRQSQSVDIPYHRRPRMPGEHVEVMDVFCKRCRLRFNQAGEDDCAPLDLDSWAEEAKVARQRADWRSRDLAAARLRALGQNAPPPKSKHS